ncbi:hypothetical protein [Sporosarcina thermotolerans]|uniref:hypothetical protein n=1 Tax=Sporosarcina thermotolerans TaxID=633404 RepID=UPI0036D2E960
MSMTCQRELLELGGVMLEFYGVMLEFGEVMLEFGLGMLEFDGVMLISGLSTHQKSTGGP